MPSGKPNKEPDMRTNPYAEYGCSNRAAYLAQLAQDYDAGTVYALADLLGPNEDFDGLVTALEDHEDELCW